MLNHSRKIHLDRKLDEPLASAPRITAPSQLGVKQVEQGTTDLADLQVPSAGLIIRRM
jgi:hypothetical protein